MLNHRLERRRRRSANANPSEIIHIGGDEDRRTLLLFFCRFSKNEVIRGKIYDVERSLPQATPTETNE